MKKLVLVLITLTLLCVPVSYAGDVPEVLLNSPTSRVFFGKVIEAEGRHVVIEQIKNIKGEFEEGSLITHEDCTTMDTRYALVGKIYLCGLSDQYNLYLWETDGMDPATLKLVNTSNIAKRMQEYLNEGLFEKKEQERLDALQNAVRTKTPSLNTQSPEHTAQTVSPSPASEKEQGAVFWPYAAAAGIIAATAVIVLLCKKHTNN